MFSCVLIAAVVNLPCSAYIETYNKDQLTTYNNIDQLVYF